MKCFDIEISEKQLQTWERMPLKHQEEIDQMEKRLFAVYKSFDYRNADTSTQKKCNVLLKIMNRLAKLQCKISRQRIKETHSQFLREQQVIIDNSRVTDALHLARMFNLRAEA